MNTFFTTALVPLLFAGAIHAETAADWVAKGDVLDRKGDTKSALSAYMEADKAGGGDAALWVKIAKEYGDSMNDLSGKARKEAAAQSLVWSKKAKAANPKSSDANLAVALSLGKNAEFMDNSAKIEASSEIKANAEMALKLNPKSDYAHHMLGRWHQNLADMGMATRGLAKIIYGGVPAASFDEALDHFQKARALRPDRLIHQIEYGRTLAMMGKKEDAKREIQKGLAMPNRDKDDAESKRRGKQTLDSL